MSRFGKSSLETLGSFRSEIKIEGTIFSTDIYVVHDRNINLNVIIGVNLLNKGNWNIKTGVSLRRFAIENSLVHIINHVH